MRPFFLLNFTCELESLWNFNLFQAHCVSTQIGAFCNRICQLLTLCSCIVVNHCGVLPHLTCSVLFSPLIKEHIQNKL